MRPPHVAPQWVRGHGLGPFVLWVVEETERGADLNPVRGAVACPGKPRRGHKIHRPPDGAGHREMNRCGRMGHGVAPLKILEDCLDARVPSPRQDHYLALPVAIRHVRTGLRPHSTVFDGVWKSG